MTLTITILTYLFLLIGSIPGLRLDRSGIALLGGLSMVLAQQWDITKIVSALHFPTLFLLYGLMVLSAQYRLAGLYTWLAQGTLGFIVSPRRFLLMIMLLSASLSALLANDIVCLAFTPVICLATIRSRINATPLLVGLALSSNIGSAMTIVGNPQNMLLGQTGNLNFLQFFGWCAPPSLIALILSWMILSRFLPESAIVANDCVISDPTWPELNRGHATKAVILTGLLFYAYFFTDWSRELSTLACAAVLLMSRSIHSRELIGLVDWHLLSLFAGLFWVQQGLIDSHVIPDTVLWFKDAGIHVTSPVWINSICIVLSNMVSNLPAVMLLMPVLPDPSLNPEAWYALALSSTFAGNILLIGSLANLIVVEQAKAYGISLTFSQHFRLSVIPTGISIVIFYLWIIAV